MRLDSNYLQAFGTLAAAVAALIALFVAWDQGRVMRQEIRASVWPALQVDGFSTQRDDDIVQGLNIQNAGVGPARIDSIAVFYQGALVTDLEALSDLFPGHTGRSATSVSGRIIGAGDTVEVFSFQLLRADGDDAVEMMYDLASNYTVDVCYCSVLDECWIAHTSGAATPKPESVDACPAEGVSNL
ncbi:hypothetical protein [Oceanicaulis sp. MMSF_3324]|uniref:hypothetical protein n=1 Tax=Oceanicaulis sp. MMSF_3324 TaxID=3046702 RepID=UPI00273E0E28|nr:hypothetical protein [Oceanicaulis sp. MMSF_3324]